ncbi:LysM peptidoglycan-binding domain-containing protein [Macrococcoides canis]|uniref:LysM peptidoglycan-binding domain-containing protein n=1 Tax=Macrococcoides canis TaxID=1855823 RepID=UPI00207C94B0|nr:LysM peptidoglycan-binding domain-containing protein [Macrococcus canis]MCO4096754.1 LysM peptidoglycan-binding domain-containing protein [Macrococcus canis]UTH08957.1 LysM peptidoglycan-binding domain-containing protein [Macrococcus canis]
MKKLLAVTTVFAVGGTFAATQADAAQYRVKSGDSLWKISQIYGTSVQALKRENGLRSNLIHVNQVLNINENTTKPNTYKPSYKPAVAPVTTGSYYRIVPGDTLGKIASRYGVSVAQLKAWNGLRSDLIIAGRTLKINGPAVAPVNRAAAPVTRTAYTAPVKRAVAKSTYQAPVRQTVYSAPAKRVTTTRTQAPAVRVNNGLNWAALARCESGGNPSINTGNGYYGMYQFNLQTWRGVGGSGYPHQASAAEQTKRAQILYNMRGAQPWPVCGAYL